MYYWGADKSLDRRGRKQARKHVRRRARFQQHRDASCHQVFFFSCKANLVVLVVILLLDGHKFLVREEAVFGPVLSVPLEENLCSCPSDLL